MLIAEMPAIARGSHVGIWTRRPARRRTHARTLQSHTRAHALCPAKKESLFIHALVHSTSISGTQAGYMRGLILHS